MATKKTRNRPTTRRRFDRRFGIESLEQRLYLSANPSVTGDLAAQANAATIASIYDPITHAKTGPLASLDQNLAYLYNEYQVWTTHGGTAQNFVPSDSALQISNGRVRLTSTPGVASSYGIVNITQLPQIAAAAHGVEVAAMGRPTLNAGAIDSEANTSLKAALARIQQSGVDGTGIRIGVLSDSYDRSGVGSALQDTVSGDLPATGVTVLEEDPLAIADFIPGTDEGRAMLQIIHDIAPGAQLFFATANVSEDDFANNIIRLQNEAKCDIIVDDVEYFHESQFQDGSVARAVDYVKSKGVAYFSSAGNASNNAYEEPFYGSASSDVLLDPIIYAQSNSIHHFGNQTVLQHFFAGPGTPISFDAQWDEPYRTLGSEGSRSDLDFYLVSFDANSGSYLLVNMQMNVSDEFHQDPYVHVSFVVPKIDRDGIMGDDFNFYIVVTNAPTAIKTVSTSGTLPPQYLKLYNYSILPEDFVGAPTISPHANAAGAFGVAAASYLITTAYGADQNYVNDFSSLGGQQIRLDLNGNHLPVPIVRQQPRATGVDGNSTTFFGESITTNSLDTPHFFGTSAAAPSLAAVAALILQNGGGSKSLTPDQIYNALTSSALPISNIQDPLAFGFVTPIPATAIVSPQYNYYAGYGLIDATFAVDSVSRTSKPPVANNDTFRTVAIPTPTAVVTDPSLNDVPGKAALVKKTITIVTQPARGTLAIDPNTGIPTYTPQSGFIGTDTYQYTISDVLNHISNIATVAIIVGVENLPPVANPDTETAYGFDPTTFAGNNTTLGIVDVLNNDSDPDGFINPQSIVITTPPTNGVATINGAGHIVYTRTNTDAAALNDSLSYTIQDTQGAVSSPVTVTINFAAGNHAPVAADDSAVTSANSSVSIPVKTNDTDVDGDLSGSPVLATLPQSGTAQVLGDFVLYTPANGFVGTDSFTYRVADSLGNLSNVATVLVTVGQAASLSGTVYIDANNNGLQDSGEVGLANVKINLSRTVGASFNAFVTTDAQGNYTFANLAPGTYTIHEVQPGFYADGKDTAGTGASSVGSVSNDTFTNVVLGSGATAAGFNFGEGSILPAFALSFLDRRPFFANSDSLNTRISLAGGVAWYAFDDGYAGELNVVAQGDSSKGTLALKLYDGNLKPLATNTGTGDIIQLKYTGTPGKLFYLKVEGTVPSVNLTATVSGQAFSGWRNLTNVFDVNGDGQLTALDALLVINSLNAKGSGSLLSTVHLASNVNIDVSGDNQLSPLDALLVVNQLNLPTARRSTQYNAGVLTANSLSLETTPLDTAVVDAAIGQLLASDILNSGTNKKSLL